MFIGEKEVISFYSACDLLKEKLRNTDIRIQAHTPSPVLYNNNNNNKNTIPWIAV